MRSSSANGNAGSGPAIAGAVALAVIALMPGLAHAGEEDGKTFFAKGRELRSANKCEEAIIEFRRALEVLPEGLGALRNIAECEEALGRFAAARRSYWDLRRALLQKSESKYDGWERDAESRYAALENKVGRVTVKLEGEQLERVKVTVDGQPLDPRLVGAELERDLGDHTVAANYGGAAPVTEHVALIEGSRLVVSLKIPAPAAAGSPPPGGGDEPAQGGGGSPARTVGFVAAGVGGLAAVATVISVVMRGSALSKVQDGCPAYSSGGPCPAGLEGDYQTAETASSLVNVFGAVAVAGLATGVTLLLVTSGGKSAPPKSAWVGAHPLPGGAGASAGVRF